jgi:phosphatidylglycerol:prolipoprotein diacylglycerol transferase
VHPTFLYESLWNLALLLILLWYVRRKKFDGEVFLWYLFGYGIGRFWIERLRTDQLLLPGLGIPVSMVVAAGMVLVSLVWILLVRRTVGRKVAAHELEEKVADASIELEEETVESSGQKENE